MERDLGSVVGDLVKPQAAFTFRTTVGDEVLLSSMQGSSETWQELASILLLTSLSGRVCLCVCVRALRGTYERGYKVVPCVLPVSKYALRLLDNNKS